MSSIRKALQLFFQRIRKSALRWTNLLKLLGVLILSIAGIILGFGRNAPFDISRRVLGDGYDWIIYLSLLAVVLPWGLLWRLLALILNIKALSSFISRIRTELGRLLNWIKVRWPNTEDLQKGIYQGFLWLLGYWIFSWIIYNFISGKFQYSTFIYFLLILSGFYVIFKIIRGIFYKLTSDLNSELNKSLESILFTRPTNLRIATFILIGSLILAVSSFAFNFRSQEILWERVVEDQNIEHPDLFSSFEINTVQVNPSQVEGVFQLKETVRPNEGLPLLSNLEYIIINGEPYTITHGFLDLYNPDRGTINEINTNLIVEMDGDNFFFPFTKYTGRIYLMMENNEKNEEINPRITIKMGTDDHSYSISRRMETFISGYSFQITFAPYYKILVFTIFLALAIFLFTIIRANEHSQLSELSIAFFATLVASRSFLVPEGLGSLLLLDQLILIFIALFITSFIYKYMTLTESN